MNTLFYSFNSKVTIREILCSISKKNGTNMTQIDRFDSPSTGSVWVRWWYVQRWVSEPYHLVTWAHIQWVGLIFQLSEVIVNGLNSESIFNGRSESERNELIYSLSQISTSHSLIPPLISRCKFLSFFSVNKVVFHDSALTIYSSTIFLVFFFVFQWQSQKIG